MGAFANFIPTLKITRQLSFSSNVRRCTSLVQVLQCHRYSNSSLSRNLTLQRFYSVDKLDKPRNPFINAVDKGKLKENSIKKCKNRESTRSILPIALIDLNPWSVNSTKVLLIPLNWQDVDENLMRKTITSIFAKRKSLRQIEAFSDALREVSIARTKNHKIMQNKGKRNSLKHSFETVKHQKELKLDRSHESKYISGNVEDRQNIVHNNETTNNLQNFKENKKHEYFFENSQNTKEEEKLTEITVPTGYSSSDSKNCSLVPFNGNNMDYLDRLATAVEKSLQQCCLQSIQMSVDANLLGEIITGLKICPTLTEIGYSEAKDILDLALHNTSNYDPLSMASIMKIDSSSLNLEEIGWHNTNPFAEIQSSSLTNITFPINVIRKSFSTRSNMKRKKLRSPSISAIRENESIDSSMFSIPPKRSSHSDMKMAPNSNKKSKCKANCNLPLLSNLFGAEELLLSCDAYNKALIEAVKRREALARRTNQLKKTKDDGAVNRHQEMRVKGCSAPTYRRDSEVNASKSPKPGPTPVLKQANKKDDLCKTPQCPNPCKDEMEKLKHKQDENAKRKINKIPIGCVSPKCEKDDSCGKLKKNPCKKATDDKPAAQVNATGKQAGDGCKKDNPCKPAECPNPCKDELEKLRRQRDGDGKNKKDKIPIGCISPKCKKDDDCSNLKKSPCKKASETMDSSSSAQKSSTFAMKYAKGRDKNNPCSDEHKEYKPKCNKDPCKKDSETSGDSCSKPTKAKPEHSKKDKSKEGDQKKKEQCKKKSTHSNESKKEDPCKKSPKKEVPCKTKEKDPCEGTKKKENLSKKKDDQCGGSKQKDNPCKEKEKKDPCGGSNKKEDPCKKKEKKDPCGGSNKKEDPCKKKEKKDPCGGSNKKEDPCKKKEKKDPCGGSNKKEDPCKKKEKKDPCGGSKKEDPCKKKEKKDPCGGSNKKEDPCKDKNSKPCVDNKKGEKSSPCSSKKKEDPCKQKKQKEDPCMKKKSSPCKKSKKKYKSKCKKSPSSSSLGSKKSDSKMPCGTPKKETKPNCSNNKKSFSTLALNGAKTSNSKIKRTFTSLTALPNLRNKNMKSFGFMHHFSSKSGKNNKKDIDHGKQSKCKSMATVMPPKRKPAYNPHPKDGLRVCYPTYDMDCKKLCKEPRKTACKRYSFLKETDNHERKGKSKVFKSSQID